MLKANPKTSWNNNECMPTVAATAYVDESAMVIGDVRIGEEVYVAPCVSLRADEANPIIIGDKCNIQDGVIFHGLMGSSIMLGKQISIAHGAVIHGPMKIGDESFVGFNSVVHASTLGSYRRHAGRRQIRAAWRPGRYTGEGRCTGTCS
jgi:carbonic anhydrase/acetyltransferase-like protein (isoleucine patch superfamily)